MCQASLSQIAAQEMQTPVGADIVTDIKTEEEVEKGKDPRYRARTLGSDDATTTIPRWLWYDLGCVRSIAEN